MSARTYVGLLLAIIARPWLWVTAVRQGWRMIPNRWWTRAPFLPVPAKAYVQFRLITQYGTADHDPYIYDVIDYLEWSRDWHSTNRSNGRRRG